MTHKDLVKKIKNVFNNNGQGMVEYILIIGLIALTIIASLNPIGRVLTDKFTEFAAEISST
jgi:Flp pilus assembly pilin Flp